MGQSSQNQKYLSTNQLAEYIGKSPAAIRNMVLRKQIPFRKPSGRLMFIRDEIENWIESAPGVRLEGIQTELTPNG